MTQPSGVLAGVLASLAAVAAHAEPLPQPAGAASDLAAPATAGAPLTPPAPTTLTSPRIEARGGPVMLTRSAPTGEESAAVRAARLSFTATLVGRLAESRRNPALAAQAYEQAWLEERRDTGLLRRSISQWVEAARPDRAIALARELPSGTRSPEADLLMAVDAFGAGRWRQVAGVSQASALDPAQLYAAQTLEALALAGQRRWDDAQAMAARSAGLRNLDRAGGVVRGLVAEARGQQDQARAAYQAAWDSGLRTPTLVQLKARAELAAGERDGALTTLSAARGDGSIEAMQRALATGQRQPRLTARQSAALALLAGAEALAQEPGASPVMLVTLALLLDPAQDSGRMTLAGWLGANGRDTQAGEVLDQIAPGGPYGIDAAVARAWRAQDRGARTEAERILASLPEPSDSVALQEARAAFDLSAERWGSAASRLTRLIEEPGLERSGSARLASLLARRARAYDGQGDWARAEADYRRAIRLQPRNASYLNGLGYGLATRGQSLDEAIDLLRRAVRLEPRSGAIIDSLGWALFQQGRFQDALLFLERAMQLEPGNAEIMDHLGDVYWRLGRTDDARIEWRKALDLSPAPTLRASLQAKLVAGLPPLTRAP